MTVLLTICMIIILLIGGYFLLKIGFKATVASAGMFLMTLVLFFYTLLLSPLVYLKQRPWTWIVQLPVWLFSILLVSLSNSIEAWIFTISVNFAVSLILYSLHRHLTGHTTLGSPSA
ncbi:MAG: hypothetical protein Q4G08_07370 [Capnocytophaga sp.]|nr:hypothetical protein [Capnocytophaga sp.]